jgi:hypothetical protein
MDCRQLTGNHVTVRACAARPHTFVGRGEVHTLQRFFENMLSGIFTSTVSSLPFSSGSIKTELEDKLTAALQAFASCTNVLFKHPNVFVYCTGRSASLCFHKLAQGEVAPIFGTKVVLQPLSEGGIQEILRTTQRNDRPLYERAGFMKAEVPILPLTFINVRVGWVGCCTQSVPR